jgi:hypothetical protein
MKSGIDCKLHHATIGAEAKRSIIRHPIATLWNSGGRNGGAPNRLTCPGVCFS